MSKEYNLEDLMKDHPMVESQTDSNAIVEEVNQEVSELTAEDRKKVDDIKSKLDLQNSSQLTMYGVGAQQNIAKFSETVLSEVRTKDSGEVGELLTDLAVSVKSIDLDEDKGFFSKLISRGKNKVDHIVTQYDTVANTINKIQARLESSQKELLKDINLFDKLYDQNLQYFKELELYIVAGEETIEDMKTNVLPKLYQQAEESGDPMAAQVVNDFQESINRFEKKVHDLRVSKTIAVQTAPQIKLIQNNDRLLVDRISSTIHQTLPTWKSQVVIALGIENQREALRLEKEITDATNEMLKENASRLKQSTLEITEEVNRSIVDVETLEHVNRELIETIEESIAINERAKEAREDAKIRINEVENELQHALLSATNPDAIDTRRRDVTNDF